MKNSFLIILLSCYVQCLGQFPVTTMTPAFQYSNYSAIYKITINSNMCGTANTTNQPILDSLVSTNLETTGNGGFVQGTSTNGAGITQPNDVVFSLQANCPSSALLNWEVISYSATTGTMLVWIQVPTITYNANTIIYMGIGNSALALQFNGGSRGAVWDGNFMFVVHCTNGVTLTSYDWTANAYDSAVSGATATTGIQDGAASFTPATPTYIIMKHINAMIPNQMSAITMEGWFNSTDVSSHENDILAQNDGNANGNVVLSANENGSVSNKMSVYAGNGNGWYNGGTLSNNNWYYEAFTMNSSGYAGYINLTSAFSGSTAYNPGADGSKMEWVLGAARPTLQNYGISGKGQEFRLSKTARSTSYLTITYWTFADNAHFLTNTRIH
jgi:trimeric autotransporter adhesin